MFILLKLEFKYLSQVYTGQSVHRHTGHQGWIRPGLAQWPLCKPLFKLEDYMSGYRSINDEDPSKLCFLVSLHYDIPSSHLYHRDPFMAHYHFPSSWMMLSQCENNLFLYADDSTNFVPITSLNGPEVADVWEVTLEPSKCKALILSREKSPSHPDVFFGISSWNFQEGCWNSCIIPHLAVFKV